jgi:hypothetical protein
MEIDAPHASVQKRTTNGDTTSKTASGKKSKLDKHTANITIPDPRPPRYWLGFSHIEKIAIDRDLPECTNNKPLEDLVLQGYTKKEAEEML